MVDISTEECANDANYTCKLAEEGGGTAPAMRAVQRILLGRRPKRTREKIKFFKEFLERL